MNKICILGNTSTVFIRDYVEYVLDDAREICILGKPSSDDVYKKDNIWISDISDIPTKGIASVIRRWKRSKDLIKKLVGIDCFQVHYVNPWSVVGFYPIWRKAKKRVLTFWGSDIYLDGKKNRLIWKIVLPNATDLIFMDKSLDEEFCRLFGTKYKTKSHIVDFGMPLYKEMETLLEEGLKSKCKKNFGIPEKKISIHVGYNGGERQQHLAIIKSLAGLPNEIKERLFITIPCGYGGSDEYKEKIEEALIESGIEGVLQKEFLDKKRNAELRYSCDVFIYGNISDAFSESPLEYAFMGAKLVMPLWLMDNYKVFNELKYQYWELDDLSNAGKVLLNCLNDKEPLNVKALRLWLRDNLSWNCLAPIWKEVING